MKGQCCACDKEGYKKEMLLGTAWKRPGAFLV